MLSRYLHQQFGHGRQFQVEFFKHLFKGRHDLDHDERQDTDGHEYHDDRVNQCAADFALERFGALQEVGKTLQDDFQGTTRFAGLDHIHVQPIERLGRLGHRFGQRGTGFDLLADIHQRVLKRPPLACPSRILKLRRIGKPASCRMDSCRVNAVRCLPRTLPMAKERFVCEPLRLLPRRHA